MLKSWYMVFFQVCIHTITKGSRKLTQKSLQIELIVKITSLCFSAQFFPSFWQCPKTQLSSTLCSKMPICPTTRRSSLMLRILGMASQQEVWFWGWWGSQERLWWSWGDLISRMVRWWGWCKVLHQAVQTCKFAIRDFPPKNDAKFRWLKHTSLHSGTTPPGTEQSTITGFCSQRTQFFSCFYSDQVLFKKNSQTKLSSSFFSGQVHFIFFSWGGQVLFKLFFRRPSSIFKFSISIVCRCAASKGSRQWVDQGVGKKLQMIQVSSSITHFITFVKDSVGDFKYMRIRWSLQLLIF